MQQFLHVGFCGWVVCRFRVVAHVSCTSDGQTGSGKTHCMSGSPGAKGIIPRMNHELFERVKV